MTLAIFTVLLLVLVIFGWWSSSIILKMPKLPVEFNPKTFGYEYETFAVETEDHVRLEGWFVPCPAGSKATILVLHGWGATRSDFLANTLPLAKRFNVACFDFRNHGRSGGYKSSLSLLEMRDYKAGVSYLKKDKRDFCQKLGVIGFSMGGAVAISGAASMPEVDAVVVESPFSSFSETVRHYANYFYHVPNFIVPVTLFFTKIRLGFDPDQYSPIRFIGKLSPRPVLIIQGESDPRMPVKEGKALYEAAREPKELWIIPGADHVGAREVNPDQYDRKLMEVFEKWLKI